MYLALDVVERNPTSGEHSLQYRRVGACLVLGGGRHDLDW